MTRIRSNRDLFYEKLDLALNSKSFNTMTICRETYAQIVASLSRKYQGEKPRSPQEYNWNKKYYLAKINGTSRIARRGVDTLIVAKEDLFDVINEAHIKTEHAGRNFMDKEIRHSYYNVTVESINIFLRLCEDCQHKKTRKSTKTARSEALDADDTDVRHYSKDDDTSPRNIPTDLLNGHEDYGDVDDIGCIEESNTEKMESHGTSLAMSHVTSLAESHVTSLEQSHETSLDESHVTSLAENHVTSLGQSHETSLDESHVTSMADSHVTSLAGHFLTESRLEFEEMMSQGLELEDRPEPRRVWQQEWQRCQTTMTTLTQSLLENHNSSSSPCGLNGNHSSSSSPCGLLRRCRSSKPQMTQSWIKEEEKIQPSPEVCCSALVSATTPPQSVSATTPPHSVSATTLHHSVSVPSTMSLSASEREVNGLSDPSKNLMRGTKHGRTPSPPGGTLSPPGALSAVQQEVMDFLNRDFGEERQFLLSLVPALKRLDNRKKSLVRLKFQQVLYDVEFSE